MTVGSFARTRTPHRILANAPTPPMATFLGAMTRAELSLNGLVQDHRVFQESG
jgi:hypothetical protein